MNKMKKLAVGLFLGALALGMLTNLFGLFATSELDGDIMEIADSTEDSQVVDFRIDEPCNNDQSRQVVDFRIDTPADGTEESQVVPFRIDTPW
ncbi:MAG: hypothetical protein RTU92_05000 [Candidatus Thorarchaeota archaeon]